MKYQPDDGPLVSKHATVKISKNKVVLRVFTHWLIIENTPDRLTLKKFYFTHWISGVLQFHPDTARKLSANLYDIYHFCVYSEKFLMMDRGTVRNM